MDITHIMDKDESKFTIADWIAIDAALYLELGDATLSSSQRKKLPDSAFCGPQRSFPIPDCAHVTAGLRLLGRYKGPGDKSKIRACIMRKAKDLGCKVSGDDNIPLKNEEDSINKIAEEYAHKYDSSDLSIFIDTVFPKICKITKDMNYADFNSNIRKRLNGLKTAIDNTDRKHVLLSIGIRMAIDESTCK